MTLFGDALRYAGNVWRFRSGVTGPLHIDETAPVIFVADTSELAKLGQARGLNMGFQVVGTSQVHAGAGTLESDLNVWGTLRALAQFSAISADTDAVWLLDTWATSTTITFSSLRQAISYPGGAMGGLFRSLFYATAVAPPITMSALNISQWVNLIDRFRYMLLPEGSLIETASTATGAGDCTHGHLLWVGPKGVAPPGLG